MVLFFLNHFQLPVRYDVIIELFLALCQDKATHISDHIQEWHRRKRLIKSYIPPEFLLEWFLKYLLTYVSKYVSISGVACEEEVISKTQQLDLVKVMARWKASLVILRLKVIFWYVKVPQG